MLTIPASSTPSERVFSTSGEVVDDRRNRMTAKLVDALVFLHRNRNLLECPGVPKDKPAVKEPPAFTFAGANEEGEDKLPDLPAAERA